MALTKPNFGPWILPDGTPTIDFYKFVVNLFNTSAGSGVATGTIQSNIGTGTNTPAANTLSAILDKIIGTGRGSTIVRGSSAWQALTLGTNGQALVSNGTDLVAALVASLASSVTLASGAPATITTAGGDLKLDSATHTLQLGTTMTTAVVAANFSATRTLAIKDGSGTTFYVPAATATW